MILYRKSKKEYIKYICIIVIIIFHSILSFQIGFIFSKKINNKKNKNKIEIFSNFTSYSQHLEDLFLFSIFHDVKNGFYIDVGAHDPNVISVTKAFYLKGWYGINIEPIPNLFKALQIERRRDINLNFGIGDKEGIASLNIDNKCRACTSLIKKKVNDTERYSYLNITIKTMSYVCKKYVPKNEEIQFCKIDVGRF